VPSALTPETIDLRWVVVDAVPELPLHPGFAATWEAVQEIG
jgi:8-oxo-dGTP diphosphatase